MFTFGFSYIGQIYLLMLFIPNGIWAKHQPEGYTSEGENRIFSLLERMGEVLCSCCVLIFSDFNVHITGWLVWLFLSFFLMILYEIYWVRYFKSNKTLEDFYKPMLGVRVPGASLPVVAFFLLGIYGTNIFLIISGIILGIGHIGIHLEHEKKLNLSKPDKKKGRRIARFAGCVVLSLLFAILIFFIGVRNWNYRIHYRLLKNGVDESTFVELGGQEQYLLIRGANVNNPVIVFLHGGPSSPESYVNYTWVDDLLDDYTVVDWDQRGCGRSYVHNIKIDPQNSTATYEQALLDLDDLVDYALNRFQRKQVIIVSHSYGTILASNYMERHPEKVSAYVGIGQVASMERNNRVMTEEALTRAQTAGKDVSTLNRLYENYEKTPGVLTTMALRQEAFSYLPETLPERDAWLAMTSPYMGIADIRWFLKQMGSWEQYVSLNQQLFDSLLSFDLYDVAVSEEIPKTYIFGSLDYVCPVSTVEDYIKEKDLNSDLYSLEGCGHGVQYAKPHEVSQILLSVLK